MKTGPWAGWLGGARRRVARIWDTDLRALPGMRRVLVRLLRIGHLVVRGFRDDDCPLHAASLTFSTLMSIVPILALSLALARGLGDADTVKDRIRTAVHEWTGQFDKGPLPPGGEAPADPVLAGGGDTAVVGAPEPRQPSALAVQINTMVDRGFEKVENISFKALGGIGLIVLLLMVVSVLGRVESSFNRVWGVRHGRSFWRRFADYLSVVVILPFLITASSSLPVVDLATRCMGEPSGRIMASLLASDLLRNAMVLLLSTLTFTFVTMFMPNTRVRLGAGFAGGLVTAILFIAWLWLCARLQFGVSRYGSIYGSFAVVPILLAWVHVSWAIILLGAEVSFAVQNHGSYDMDQVDRQANVHVRLAVALAVLGELAGRSLRGSGRLDVNGYAAEHHVPIRLANGVVDELEQAGLLGRIGDETGGFALLRAPGQLRVGEVADVLLVAGAGAGDTSGAGCLPAACTQAARQALSDQAHTVWNRTIADIADAP